MGKVHFTDDFRRDAAGQTVVAIQEKAVSARCSHWSGGSKPERHVTRADIRRLRD